VPGAAFCGVSAAGFSIDRQIFTSSGTEYRYRVIPADLAGKSGQVSHNLRRGTIARVMPAPAAPRPFTAVDTGGLSPIDAYAFDVGGWIVVRGALDGPALARCRAAVATTTSSAAATETLTAVAEQQRTSVLAPYLRGLMFEGSSFGSEDAVLDGTPSLLPQPEPQQPAPQPAPLVAGSEHLYASQPNGVALTQGLRCFWALSDSPPEQSNGFCILAASHNSFHDVPRDVLEGGAADELLLWPRLAAGDVLIAASSLVYGVRNNDNHKQPGLRQPAVAAAGDPQLVLTAEFLSTTARGAMVDAGVVAPVGTVDIPSWAASLSSEERAVLGWHDDTKAPLLTDGVTSWVGPADQPREHPSVYTSGRNQEAVDEVELWKWTLGAPRSDG
jgi:hypothetical protein